ncbi:MAG: hypothetical protein LBF90_07300 [Prevotellaceae bacterium]|jgi:hypothetical protein|nr:hypothetical protein [Prevotellaceae bacterium]
MKPLLPTDHRISRRTFIKSGIVLASAIPALGRRPLRAATPEPDGQLFALFQNPPAAARPFVRWWWNGNKLTADEILRELDVLHDAGIGGVEINPIAFPGGDDLAIPSMDWLSPEWIDMVNVALQGASERGMICDTIVGSGWPFGAEFLTDDDRSQLLTLTARKARGAGRVEWPVADVLAQAAPEVGSKYAGATAAIEALYLAPVQMDVFRPPVRLPFDANADVLRIDIPEGEHILYVLVKSVGFQAVINGAPGASGPVLNHYRQEAVERFLSRMSERLFPALSGGARFRALFCDSMELEGANWCPDFPAEFRRRRGYEVEPYLPFILYRVGHMGQALDAAAATTLTGAAKEEVARVRHDFFATCMELVRDRFLTPYTQWCRRHGFRSRVQAYGREFHLLEASLPVDIPECETWMWSNDGGEARDFARHPAYTNVNKFVASAAHYAGRRVVSCEEATNTEAVFNATLERLKVTGDQSNLSGVTHSIVHGFNYSPAAAPLPGWVRYGMYLNERNPWWPHFRLWTDYKARLSAVLQASEAFADIAVLHPLADLWTRYGPQREPFPERAHPPYQHRVWEGIHHNGNACDYISESLLQQGVAADGWFRYGDRRYHTLLLLEVESLAPATAAAIARFAARGGRVVMVGCAPSKSTGRRDYRRRDRRVAHTMAAMRRDGTGRVWLVEAPDDDVVRWFGNIQRQCGIRPYLRLDRPNEYVGQIRHRTARQDLFFLSNCHTETPFTIACAFDDVAGVPWLWDPETGERYRLPTADDGRLWLTLPPAASRLVVFDAAAAGPLWTDPPSMAGGLALDGWRLRMEHVDGTVQEHPMAAPGDLAADERTRAFAGRLCYETDLDHAAATAEWLDLGRVYGVSEVALDDRPLGRRWYGQHLYRLPPPPATRRSLRITITTTLGNYFKANPANAVGQAWTRRQPWQPVGLIGPVRLR